MTGATPDRRRVGVAGTVLGVVVVVAVEFLMAAHRFSDAWFDVFIAALILAGLGVSRTLENIMNGLNQPRVIRPAGYALPAAAVPPGPVVPGPAASAGPGVPGPVVPPGPAVPPPAPPASW